MFFSLGVRMEVLIWAGETTGAPICCKKASDFWMRDAACLVRVDLMVLTGAGISLARGE